MITMTEEFKKGGVNVLPSPANSITENQNNL
jgi:hypothetical protein